MKTFPATFVGEFTDADSHWKLIANVGDVLIENRDGERAMLLRCACAIGEHFIPLAPSMRHRVAWDCVAVSPPHIEPSVLTRTMRPNRDSQGNVIDGDYEIRCHLFLRAGQLQILDDTFPAVT